ncbi:5'-nucleotidase, exopolyphosphatase, 3'-nucleotidase [Desulfocurvibacter africanus PCS]|uniref:5'-nucleotidase SurE n=1 Tax=Desulfocurvibacter africanus PCS TaxID=1262666 RepID=M5PP25_DESAF|nr:5'/3'-nucleotidase SurE [Desulfocurvibacter africanus]EMG35660.1 5'-nucleotidase, exopolyphosphatase, 3'-nucleotidase [Desulfocurvibacter africanus PCS]
MRILLTNDDGIQAPGLRALYRELKRAGLEVHCVAPISEMSAVGHAITFAMPLRVKEFVENGFRGQGVSGTPADCVKLGISTLLEAKPDLVVSGINAGANVGVDVLYSGTVSAATEGALMGYPALAVSMDTFHLQDPGEQAAWTARFIQDFDWSAIPDKTVLNLNFPHCPLSETKGLTLCRQTPVPYEDWYERRDDPRGRPYYWLDGVIPPEKLDAASDRALLTEGHITLTPLRFDFTCEHTLEYLKGTLKRS